MPPPHHRVLTWQQYCKQRPNPFVLQTLFDDRILDYVVHM